MAADPISIVTSILVLLFDIKGILDRLGSNNHQCHEIGTLIDILQAIVKGLPPGAEKNEGISLALKHLKETLEQSRCAVDSCAVKKNLLLRAIEANHTAEDLGRLRENISGQVSAMKLAVTVFNSGILGDVLDALKKVDDNQRQCHQMYQIISVLLPDRDSTERATDQNKQESLTEKTDDVARSEVTNDKDNLPAADIKLGISGVPGETGSSYKIISESETSKTSELLELYPQQLCSPIGPNKETTHCPVTLTNKMDDHYVWIKQIDEQFTIRATAMMEPHSTLVVPVTMRMMHEEPPTENTGKFEIISRPTKDMTHVTSIDVHPTKPWMVTGHKGGFVSIWNYDQKQIVMEKQITKVPGSFANVKHKYSQFVKETAAPHWVCSVKFIAEEEWVAVGDGRGCIRVYTYTDTKLHKVDEFRAGHGESVDSLAVHPTNKYLLSSSAYGRKINLWDWSNGSWEKIHEFDIEPTYARGVLSLKFNPRDTETFACVTDDGRLQVGNIKSFSLTTKLKGQLFEAADYFFTRSRQNLMVTLRSKSPDAEILDLETGEVVGTLAVSARKTRRVAGHPTLPILVTALDDGTICFWDANNIYRRLGENVRITDSSVRHLKLFADTNDIARLVVTFKSMMISIMEINLPRANTSGGQIASENDGGIP